MAFTIYEYGGALRHVDGNRIRRKGLQDARALRNVVTLVKQ